MGLLVAELFAPSFGVLGAGGVVGVDRRRDSAVRRARSLASACRWPWSWVWRPRRRRSSCSAAAWRSRRVAGPSSAAAKACWARRVEVLQVERWRNLGRRFWANAGGWPATEPLAPGQRVRVVGLRGLTLEVQADAQSEYQYKRGSRHERLRPGGQRSVPAGSAAADPVRHVRSGSCANTSARWCSSWAGSGASRARGW